jgi:hypothetical protein
MQAQCSPSWTRGSAPGRRASDVNPGMRVSDAERAAVTDRLAKHYGDGRLSQAEFDERMDKAMTAKTQSDFGGLLADLPGTETAEPAPSQRRRHPRHRFLVLLLVVVLAAAVGHVLMRSAIPWLLIGLLAFLWLRRGPRQQHRRW